MALLCTQRKLRIIGASVALGILIAAVQVVKAQQTTTTNCSTSGSNTNCMSNTTDDGAQQQRAYEQGQHVGDAIGQGIAAGMQVHAQSKWVKKYCAAHPGEGWRWFRRSDGHTIASGHCPTDVDKALAAANTFMSKHRDYTSGPANSRALTAYIDAHKLDPREEKSYERAYKDLKKSGQLDLYAKN